MLEDFDIWAQLDGSIPYNQVELVVYGIGSWAGLDHMPPHLVIWKSELNQVGQYL